MGEKATQPKVWRQAGVLAPSGFRASLWLSDVGRSTDRSGPRADNVYHAVQILHNVSHRDDDYDIGGTSISASDRMSIEMPDKLWNLTLKKEDGCACLLCNVFVELKPSKASLRYGPIKTNITNMPLERLLAEMVIPILENSIVQRCISSSLRITYRTDGDEEEADSTRTPPVLSSCSLDNDDSQGHCKQGCRDSGSDDRSDDTGNNQGNGDGEGGGERGGAAAGGSGGDGDRDGRDNKDSTRRESGTRQRRRGFHPKGPKFTYRPERTSTFHMKRICRAHRPKVYKIELKIRHASWVLLRYFSTRRTHMLHVMSMMIQRRCHSAKTHSSVSADDVFTGKDKPRNKPSSSIKLSVWAMQNRAFLQPRPVLTIPAPDLTANLTTTASADRRQTCETITASGTGSAVEHSFPPENDLPCGVMCQEEMHYGRATEESGDQSDDHRIRNPVCNVRAPQLQLRDNVSVESADQESLTERDLQARLREEEVLNARLRAGLLCRACLRNNYSIVLLPCGHVLCPDCSFGVTRCPFCRSLVVRKQAISD